jgi:ATP-dependent RNA helicase RhlE
LYEVIQRPAVGRVLVFTRTKRGADVVARGLSRSGIRADAIHGNKSQGARGRVLQAFRTGKIQVLVATDLAARGIDIDDITHVVNFDMPHEPESYVHRIGRTGRAGASGVALSFCDASERGSLRAIERLIRCTIRVDAEHPYHAAVSQPAGGPKPVRASRNRRKPRARSKV